VVKVYKLFLILVLSIIYSNLSADGFTPVRSDLPPEMVDTIVPAATDVSNVEAEMLAVDRLLQEEGLAPITNTSADLVEVESAVPQGDTTVLTSSEVTQEEAQQEAQRREAARLLAEERARTAELTAANTQAAENASGEEAQCLRDKQNLISHQRRVFDLKTPRGASLIELLKKQDDLKARIATYQALYDIWKQYQNFLDENDSLVANQQINTPASAQAALASLSELESFLDKNQEPVERYHVVSEVLLSLPNRDELKAIQGGQEKLNYIKRKIQARCSDSANSHLYICGINPETDIQLEAQITRNPRNRAEFINKFVNTMVQIDGADFVWNTDFSTLFVDDPNHTNQTGDVQFAGTLKAMIQKAKEHCRENILLGDSNEVTCLTTPLNQVMGNSPSEAETKVIERLQTLHPEGGAINNVADLSSSYLEMAKKTKNFHEEMSGGTINEIGSLTENIDGLRERFQTAEAALTTPGALTGIRQKFKDLTAEKILNLGRTLNHGEFRTNQEVYKKYLEGHENLLTRPGSLNLGREGNENKADFANRLVRDILCQNSSSGTACPIDQDIFSLTSNNGQEDLALNQDNIMEIFNRLTSTIGGRDQLKEMLGEGKEQGLKDELAQIQADIATIKNGRDYQELNGFKEFIWDQVRASCLSGSGNEVTTHVGTSCLIAPGIQSGLNDFLQVGSELLSFNDREEDRKNLNQVYDSCLRIHSEERDRYDREYSNTNICPTVFNERQRVDRQNIVRAESIRRGPARHDPNIIYKYDRDGKVVDRHVPSSNLAIFLPQLAYTANEQMPFYFIQRPGMNMAIDSWRTAGFQQKTTNAYWASVNQSFINSTVCGQFSCFFNNTMLETASPTFGNSGFNF